MKTNHLHWIDISKGIGIVLVILGHCIFPCHAVIDIFHMPLFFLLAGVTFHVKPAESFIIGKINRIFIPYVFWAILSAICNYIPHNYRGVFNGPLWFLPVMFSTLMVMYLINHTSKNIQYIIISLFLIISWLFVENPSLISGLPFSLNLVILSTVYMFIGKACSVYIIREKSYKNGIFISSAFALGFCLLFLWLYQNYDLTGAYVSTGLYESNYWIVLICSIFGIFTTIFVSKLINKSHVLEWLGQNSLVLMCVHFPFTNSINVFASKLPLYGTFHGKVLIASIEYIIVFGISILLTVLCKKYLQRLTGYTPLIKNSTPYKNIAC